MTLDEIVDTQRIIVCVGSGGVGKTTTAASIALESARRGRRTLVMTIDPARRLANSLGLEALEHTQRRVESSRFVEAQVDCKGELWAMMLDTKRAFDEMVSRHAPSEEVRDRVLENRIYRYISTRLPGSQEYMAMDQLHAIHSSGRYDLIVLDTPPTANALDFLHAPDKLIAAIDSAAIRWFLKPFEKGGSFSLRFLGMGSAYMLKTLSRFTGAGLLEEIARFLLEFSTLLDGFKRRAADTIALLRSDVVRFVLVTSPEPLTLDEAIFFRHKLRESGMPFGAFVVNRVHPDLPEPPSAAQLAAELAPLPVVFGLPPARLNALAEDLVANQVEHRCLAAIDQKALERLQRESAASARDGLNPETLIPVPALPADVHDLQGLAELGRHLFQGARR